MARPTLGSSSPPRRMATAAVVMLSALATGWLLLAWVARPLFESQPIVSVSTSIPRPAAASSATAPSAAFPPELVAMEVAVSTALAPTVTPTPPQPTATSLPCRPCTAASTRTRWRFAAGRWPR